MRKLVLFVLLSCVMVAAFACRPVHYTPDAGAFSDSVTRDISIYEADLKEVRKAIIRACTSLTWRPKQVDENTIRASILVRGKHTVVLDIVYNEKSFIIKYVSSINMGAGANGRIHPNYHNWVIRLANTIEQELNMGTL